MPASARELVFLITAEDKASKEFEKVQRQVEATAKQMISVGKTMSLAVTAPLTLMGGLFVKAAGDAAEMENRFKAVFGSLADSSETFAEDLGDAVGRSTIKIKDSLTVFQGFAVGVGFGKEQAQSFSHELEKLALDFASFHNVSDAEALRIFTSALAGSTEVMDRFGINIRQSTLDIELQKLGLAKSANEATEMQRTIARLSVIMTALTEQGAVGDAIRTSKSFINQTKTLNDQFFDLRVEIGQKIIPTITSFIKQINSLFSWFGSLNDNTVKIIITFATFAAILGPSILIVGKITQAYRVLTAVTWSLRAATLALMGPWGWAIAAASALAAVVGFKLFSATEDATAITDEARKKAEEFAATLDPGLVDSARNSADSLKRMNKEAQDAAKEMEKLRKEALKTIKDFNEDEIQAGADLAEASIEQSEKVAKLTDELQLEKMKEGRNRDEIKIAELQENLNRETESLRNAAFIRIEFADQIAEAQRRTSLTEFERRVEDILRERKVNLERHLERMQQMIEELNAARIKNQAIAESYAAAQASMRKETEETTLKIQTEMGKQGEAVDSVIRKFASLGESSRSTPVVSSGLRLKGGFQFGSDFIPRTGAYLLHKGEQVVQAGKAMMDGGVVVNINGGYFLSETVAEELGDLIVRRLNRTMKL